MTPAAFATAVSALSLDTTAYFGLALTVLTALTIIWGVRKSIKLANRS